MKKLIMQFDAYYGDYSNSDPQELVKVLFYNIDHGHAKPEIILWETHPFLPDECPENNTKECNTFCARGIDMMRILIDETKKRGIKAYFHYRISEVDKGFRKNPPEWNSVKREHPDWCIKSWYWQGTWNLASEALQKFKLNYLEQILREYEFDGICVDFLRHLPCLPLGKQWEHRDCVTEFLRGIRSIADSLPHELRVGAKLPETQVACHADGFDPETWCRDGITDFLVAGSRSIHVDVEWYKQIACRAEIFPCWDSWHTSDACHWMDDAFYRGVIANWIAQGADGVVGFNYMSAPPEILMRVIKAEDIYESKEDSTVPYANFADFARQFRDAFRPELPRTYSAERRGGYPYRTGMGGENLTAPLPAALPNDGSVCEVPVPVLQDYSGRSVQLRLLISNAKEECDRFRMFCNGRELTNVQTNFRYVDPQIFWPEPQPYSGGNYCYASNPSPLLLLSAEVDGTLLKNGENLLGVSVIDRVNYWLDCDAICVERAEITGNAD